MGSRLSNTASLPYNARYILPACVPDYLVTCYIRSLKLAAIEKDSGRF